MGTWGYGSSQNDLALDVKDSYIELLQQGMDKDEACRTIVSEFENELNDADDAPAFWIALADVQWRYGKLDDMVKANANAAIDQEIERWLIENPKLANKRKAVLEKVREKINSPMPKEKTPSKPRIFKTSWKDGDTFAYRLDGAKAEEIGYAGKYIIIRKVDECEWGGHVIPVVYFSIWASTELPQNADDIAKAKYVIATQRRYMTEYRFLIIMKSEKDIPHEKITYLGNYPDIPPPKDEGIIKDKVMMVDANWSNMEQRVLMLMLRYNEELGI